MQGWEQNKYKVGILGCIVIIILRIRWLTALPGVGWRCPGPGLQITSSSLSVLGSCGAERARMRGSLAAASSNTPRMRRARRQDQQALVTDV